MSEENEIQQTGDTTGITSPDAPTHEATRPPGNPEPDPDKVREAVEQLEQPGGGH